MAFISTLKKLLNNLPKKSAKPKHEFANTPYSVIGGESKVRALANGFYDNMLLLPEVKSLLAIHPQPMDSIRQRFFEYLSGWLGGPPLFEQKYGHPRLRARHLPFKITSELAEQWMLCMDKALDDHVDDNNIRAQLHEAFSGLAQHMVNTE